MASANRTLSADVIEALTYWPDSYGLGKDVPTDPVDLSVLPPLFDALLLELPWWNRDWKVTHVEHGRPSEVASDHDRSMTGFTEVSVPGFVGTESGDALPFFARVRFEGDQLIRFQAKIGDMVLGPANAPAGQPEPHPFGKVFSKLMDLRGISIRDAAVQSVRSMSTINILRSGRWNPHPILVREIAAVLSMSEEDVAAIAGLDD
ncbi:hypothetical protein Rhe02_69440 [Rhizocola hellebori]|uniref:XRE family transcriptional regulator n=1 Tax=Rhizocola hellebori TaxID=1392758 RepID=A0A8J3VJV3_9ACTN|nr:helix-turn-helix transcriptional regulator [Rhizocola hellebori]GIH08877.1 hypothetical protein Rhe02_69440 [Rhizocola hellebori]